MENKTMHIFRLNFIHILISRNYFNIEMFHVHYSFRMQSDLSAKML